MYAVAKIKGRITEFIKKLVILEFGNSTNDNFNLSRAGTGGSNLPDISAEFSKANHGRGSVSMARWFVASRGKALAIATLGFSFGEAILPMTVAFLLSFLYWRSIWVAAAVVSLITIPILIKLLKHS